MEGEGFPSGARMHAVGAGAKVGGRVLRSSVYEPVWGTEGESLGSFRKTVTHAVLTPLSRSSETVGVRAQREGKTAKMSGNLWFCLDLRLWPPERTGDRHHHRRSPATSRRVY